eukprot:1171353-Rhodomonas_salina.2
MARISLPDGRNAKAGHSRGREPAVVRGSWRLEGEWMDESSSFRYFLTVLQRPYSSCTESSPKVPHASSHGSRQHCGGLRATPVLS